MSITSIGDLAQSYLSRRTNAKLKSQVTRLTNELSSNRISDLSKHLAGDFGQLASIERSLKTLDVYRISAKEAELFLNAQQFSLEAVQSGLDSASTAMMSAGNSIVTSVLNIGARAADAQFRGAVSAVNSPAAGRSLFSGTQTDVAPLRTAEEIMAELTTLVAGQTDAASIVTLVDDWFMQPGGGYETFAYQGSPDALAPFKLGERVSVDAGITALNEGVRSTLKALALGALMVEGRVTSDFALQKDVMAAASDSAFEAKGQLTNTQSVLGVIQQQVEVQQARISAEDSAMQIARGELTNADPFETATRLEDARFQLEALYTVTARVSRMSLVDYLR